MDYKPRQEQDIRSSMVLDPGVYDFEVTKAEEKVSKSNNDMIELTVRVFPHDGGSPRLLRDWLVAGSDMGELKINRFAHATGLQDAYFEGSLNGFSCQGASGKLRLTIESSEQYGSQNRIKDYVIEKPDDESQVAPAKPHAKAAQDPEEGFDPRKDYEQALASGDDSIPF